MLKKIKNYFKRVRILEQENKNVQERLMEIEHFMSTAKAMKHEKSLNTKNRNKWLNGYPDDEE